MTKPPQLLTAAARVARVRMSALLVTVLGISAVLNADRPFPVDLCVLHSLTGLSCPTCGLTRAVCHVMQGDLAASLGFHPAGILVVTSLAAWAAWSALEAWRGQVLWRRGQNTLARIAGASIALTSLVAWVVR